MKIYSADIPDDTAELASWLETKLVDGELRSLISQLAAVHGTEPKPLAELLQGKQDAVMSDGLACLTRPDLQALLQHPVALLELQELILLAQSNYWQKRLVPTEVDSQAAASSWKGISKAIAGYQSSEQKSESPVEYAVELPPKETASRGVGTYLSIAAAACVVLIGGFWVVRNFPGAKSNEGRVIAHGWKWTSDSEPKEDMTAEQYLLMLSEAAKVQSGKPIQEEQQLVAVLREFSEGCEFLSLASHGPLTDADEAWLVYQCKRWKTKLDELVVQADSSQRGAIQTTTVRDQALELMNEVVAELNERALRV